MLKSTDQKSPIPTWWWGFLKRKKSRSWKSKMRSIPNFSNNIILMYFNQSNNSKISVRMAKLYNWNGQMSGKIARHLKAIAQTSLRTFSNSLIHLKRSILQRKTYSINFSIWGSLNNRIPKRPVHKKSIKSWRKKPPKCIQSSNNLNKFVRWNRKIANSKEKNNLLLLKTVCKRRNKERLS